MTIKRIYLCILALTLCLSPAVTGQNFKVGFDNQVSTWVGSNYTDRFYSQAGLRYIPTLSPSYNAGSNSKFDAEISLNTYGNLTFTSAELDTATYDIRPYRLWLRYSNSNLEIRAGLQKINFGSSNILRPLMWFDNIDFRDPLQLTNGVYALLGRYYFNNNANIWLWTLYGNKDTKGWEVAPSLNNIPEYGGRIQFPVPKGEFAFSYHHRDADYSDFYPGSPVAADTRFTEQMFGIDGKWDIGPGVWFEYSGKLNDKDNLLLTRWENYFSLGMDYTFNLGNGLTASTEYFRYSNGTEDEQLKTTRNYSTLTLSYPLFLNHNISGMVYYNWDTEEWYRFLNLQLKYDYLSMYLMAFWNPDEHAMFIGNEGNSSFAGKGFQIMVVLDI